MSSYVPLVRRPAANMTPAMKQPRTPIRQSSHRGSIPEIGAYGGMSPAHLEIQAKLRVGPVNDPLEQEADRIAEQVTATLQSGTVRGTSSGGLVQRKFQAYGEDESPDIQRKPRAEGAPNTQPGVSRREPVASIGPISPRISSRSESAGATSESFDARLRETRQTGGERLPPQLGEPMGTRLGLDMSGVRIHRNAAASHLAREIHAQAFTSGQDVFFKAGAYRPETTAGQRLLAHELVHVAQQRGSVAPSIQRSIDFDPQAAEATAKEVDNKGKVSDSMSLFWEFIGGLLEHLGLRCTWRKDTYHIDKVEDADNAVALEQKILAKFAEGKEVQDKRGGYTRVSAADAKACWDTIRSTVKEKVGSGFNVGISHDKRWSGPLAARSGGVHVKPDWVANTYIRKGSQWNLFWIFLHEMLHLAGLKDAMSADNMFGEPLGDEREIALQGPARTRKVTFIGDVEFHLNVIRIGLGLPVRTNYSDTPPAAARNPRKQPTGIFFADQPGRGQREYVGSVIVDPTLSKTEKQTRFGDLSLPKDFDAKATSAKMRDEAAAKRGGDLLAPGLLVDKLLFRHDGEDHVVQSPKISIKISKKGDVTVSGKYEYEHRGNRRSGAVSGGTFTLDGISLHIVFDWSDSPTSKGTADLALPMSEFKEAEYSVQVEFTGTWQTSDGKAGSSMAMQVRRITSPP